MRFVIDNQLPQHLADWLRQQGHDCDHVLELEMDNASDLEVWSACHDRQAALITKDEDFIYLPIEPVTAEGSYGCVWAIVAMSH